MSGVVAAHILTTMLGYGDTGSPWVTHTRANILGGAGGGAGGPALSHSFVARLAVHPLGTPCAEIHAKHSVSCCLKQHWDWNIHQRTMATVKGSTVVLSKVQPLCCARLRRCAVQGSTAVLCKVQPLRCAVQGSAAV